MHTKEKCNSPKGTGDTQREIQYIKVMQQKKKLNFSFVCTYTYYKTILRVYVGFELIILAYMETCLEGTQVGIE